MALLRITKNKAQEAPMPPVPPAERLGAVKDEKGILLYDIHAYLKDQSLNGGRNTSMATLLMNRLDEHLAPAKPSRKLPKTVDSLMAVYRWRPTCLHCMSEKGSTVCVRGKDLWACRQCGRQTPVKYVDMQ